MRIVAGPILIVHGFARLVGFVVPWRLMVRPEGVYKTTLLAGKIDVGHTGIRTVGIFWFIAAMAFAASGVGLFTPAAVVAHAHARRSTL